MSGDELQRVAAVRAAYEEDLSDIGDRPRSCCTPRWSGRRTGRVSRRRCTASKASVTGGKAITDPWESIRFEVRELIEVDDETMFVWIHGLAREEGSSVDVEMNAYDVLDVSG